MQPSASPAPIHYEVAEKGIDPAKEQEAKGPTRNPTIGFAALVCAVLIGLTMLLSGCIRITTTIHIPGPDRVQLGWEVNSSTQKLMPWQLHLKEALSLSAPSVNVEQNSRLGQQNAKFHQANTSADCYARKGKRAQPSWADVLANPPIRVKPAH